MDKIITALTPTSVSILSKINGVNHRKAYENSESGRQNLIDSEPDYIVEKVIQVWGDVPTVKEPVYEIYPPEPTLEDHIENIEESITGIWDDIADAIQEGIDEV